MNIQFLPEARGELLDAVAYYEGQLSGLGLRLWDEVDHHIAWINRNHEVPRLRLGGYRRVNLNISVLHFVHRPRPRHLDSCHRARSYSTRVLDRSAANNSVIDCNGGEHKSPALARNRNRDTVNGTAHDHPRSDRSQPEDHAW